VTTPNDWRLDALCAQVDPELYFPEPGAWGKLEESARQLCWECPVREICLAEVMPLEELEDYGTAGGYTAKQRREMRKQNRNAGRQVE